MNMDWFRPNPARIPEVVLEAQKREARERVEAILWWAEQPARIAARLAGGRS